MTEPRVTFVMPAYNAEAFISRSIESIRYQSTDCWRLVIVNDGSTDNTLSIARGYALIDARISVESNDAPSGGCYQPRIRAAKLAHTGFVAPVDADDTIGPDYLRNMLPLLDSSGADIVYPTMYLTGEGRTSPQRYLPEAGSKVYGKTLSGRDCFGMTVDGWKIGCGGGIIRRSVYLEAAEKAGEKMSYPFCDELHTRHLLLLARNVCFSDQPYYYLMHPESVIHTISVGRFYNTLNNIAIIRLALENFGAGSREYIKAQRQNFHKIFELLHDLREFRLSRRDEKLAMSMLREAREAVDWKILRGEVSPRLYLALRLLPMTIIRRIR